MNHTQSDLIKLLSNDNKVLVLDISSQFPSQIINNIEADGNRHNVIALMNQDVWRYSNDLKEYIENDQKTYYIITLGYKNKTIATRMHELSYPCFYFRRRSSNLEFKKNNLIYGFSCLNNREGHSRLILGHSLFKHNLLKNIIFTQNLIHADDIKPNSYIFQRLDQFDDYKKLLPIRYPPTSIKANFCGDHTINHAAYQEEAYCNIVTESETENLWSYPSLPLPVITEKSYKPFISCQIPLFLAAQGHLSYLKDLGFEVMDDLLPEGYDDFNTFQKVEAITHIISQGKEFIEDFYFSHLREIQHNHELVTSKTVDRLIVQRIKTFIDNL